MRVRVEDLAGVREIAEMLDVTPQAVCNWRERHADFPTPLAILRMGAVFSRSQVQRWYDRRERK